LGSSKLEYVKSFPSKEAWKGAWKVFFWIYVFYKNN
jgi:hypothetical protein